MDDILSKYGYKNKNTMDMRPAEAQQRDNLPILQGYGNNAQSFTMPEATPLRDIGEGALAGLKGLGQGITNFDAGAIQALLYGGNKLGLVSDQRLQNYQNDIAKMQQEQVASNPLGGIGRAVGNIIPAVTLPTPVGKSILGNLAVQTGLGGVYGAMSPATDKSQIDQNALTGAGIGAVAGLVSSIPAAAKALFSTPVPEAEQILKEAKNLNIKPTVGQVTGNSSIRSIENASTQVPVLGTYNAFDRQVQTLKKTAEEMVGANKPLSEINKNIYDNLVATKLQKTAQSSAMVDDFTNLANQVQSPVPFNETKAVITNLTQGKNSLWRKIGTAEKDLAEEAVRQVNTALTDAQNTQTASQAIDLRKLLLQSGRESKGPVKHVYNELAAAVDRDITNFASQNSPELAQKYHDWSKFYKTEVLPFNSKSVLKTLTNPKIDLDKVFSTVMKKDSFYRANTIAKNVSDATKGEIAGEMIGQAFKAAISEKTKAFNPNTFIAHIENLGQTKDIFLSNATKTKLTSYAKVLQALELSAKQRIGSATNMALGAGGTIALTALKPEVAASVFLLSHALTSPKTSSMLVKLAKLNESSQAFKRGFSNLQFAVLQDLNKNPDKLPEDTAPVNNELDILTRYRNSIQQGQ